MIILLIVISLIVIVADWRVTQYNYGAVWNGIGSVESVLRGDAKIPMRHRVLVPWLCKYIKYIYIRWASIVLAVVMSHLYFDNIILTMAMALFMVWALMYDYTDVYLEIAGFAGILLMLPITNGWYYSILPVVTLLMMLNRETGAVIPFFVFFMGDMEAGALCAGAAVAGYLIPRLMYPGGERYCKFNMIKENIRRIVNYRRRHIPLLHDEYLHFFVLFAIVVYGYSVAFSAGVVSPFDIAMAVFFVAMLVPSVWSEIRVFSPVMLSIIPIVLKGVKL